jgi:hypothetical protein
MKTAVVRARIPEELKKKFEAVATVHDMSLSHVIRTLIVQYVENENEMTGNTFKCIGKSKFMLGLFLCSVSYRIPSTRRASCSPYLLIHGNQS